MTDIEELGRRVAEARGPDRALDARIHHALFPTQRVLLDGGKAVGPGPKRPPTYGTLADVDLSDWDDANADKADKDGMAGLFEAPAYTSSIDAVVVLVGRLLPENWRWYVDDRTAAVWPDGTYDESEVSAASPALSLLLALLKALSSIRPNGGAEE